LESKIKKERKKQEEGQDKHDEKYKEMQATIQRNETVIQMLKMQLAQFQQRRNSEVESVSCYLISLFLELIIKLYP
jgi:septal ring factor EnvC (AmiA/AmiB activator)